MPKRVNWDQLETEHGDLQTAIPKLLNKFGSQQEVAEKLEIAPSTLSEWLRRHKFVRKMQWVKDQAS